MSYEKQKWNKYDELKTEEENIENGAVVTDNRMNHIEEGIEANNKSLDKHIANIFNPHQVTAAQVGLDKVDNIQQASKVAFDAHTSDVSNPHQVTAAQVGLDKVDNIQQAAKIDFDSHVNNIFNPHEVTASQVGTYTKVEIDNQLVNKADDSKIIHKTGDETIAGKKTFTDTVSINNLEVTGNVTNTIVSVPFTNSPILDDGNVDFFRIGNVVYCSIQARLKPKHGSAFYDLILKEIPTGFKPRRTEVCSALSYNVTPNIDGLIRGAVIFNGSKDSGIRMTHPATKDSESGIFVNTWWLTNDPWPITEK